MTDRPVPVPYEGFFQVRDDWLDDNGHMNVAFYIRAFDEGSNPFFDDIGLGWDYTRSGVGSVFMVNCNLDFKRELFAGDALRVTTQLIDWNDKLLHLYLALYNVEKGYLAAVSETMFIHISFATRRGTAMPEEATARLDRVMRAHSAMGRPANLGRPIGIRRQLPL